MTFFDALPCMMIVNAILFAVLLVINIVPPLYIFNPDNHPNVSMGPPTAGGILPDNAVSPSVQQKLYILFVLPACAVLNSLFLYFTYYRHVRHIQFRVERSSVASANLLATASAVVPMEMSLSAPSGASFARPPTGHSFLAAAMTQTGDGAKANAGGRGKRHTRPDGLSLHAFTTSPLFPELRQLQQCVGEHFLQTAEVRRMELLHFLDGSVFGPDEERRGLPSHTLFHSVTHLMEHHTWVLSEVEAKAYMSTAVGKPPKGETSP